MTNHGISRFLAPMSPLPAPAEVPKMMSIGLHLRMIGRPGRIAGLERALAHMRSRGGVWFARRDAIARHWIARFDRRAAA